MVGRKSSVAGSVSFAILFALGGCGGGGGGGDARVISQALVADSPSGCAIEAEVDTRGDVHGVDGVCLVSVDFHLFDATGSELDVSRPLSLLPPERSVSFHLQICRGEIAPPSAELKPATGRTSLFLIPDVDHCPSATTAPGLV